MIDSPQNDDIIAEDHNGVLSRAMSWISGGRWDTLQDSDGRDTSRVRPGPGWTELTRFRGRQMRPAGHAETRARTHQIGLAVLPAKVGPHAACGGRRELPD